MILTTEQEIVVARMRTALIDFNASILKVGLRGGANAVINEIINQMDFKEVCLFSADYKVAMHYGNEWDRRTNVQFQKWPELYSGSDVLVVIADAFNTPHSYGIYLLARSRGHRVLVFGSNGPEYARIYEWQRECETLGLTQHGGAVESWNAWDLNPKVDEAELRLKFGNDPRFERDFCAF